MLDTITISVGLPTAVTGGRSAEDLAAELRRLAVLDAFRRREIGEGKAARLLGLPRVAFLELCGRYDIPTIAYSVEDFEAELADIQRRGY